MRKKRCLKVLSGALAVAVSLSLMTACTEPTPSDVIEATPTPEVADVTPTPTPEATVTPSDGTVVPTRTYSPIVISTPTPEPTPTPTPTATPLPHDNPNYKIYLLERGDGEFAYAWTEENPISSEVIEFGTQSDEVLAVQKRLYQLGFYCVVNSKFDTKTQTALNEFQKIAGLTVTTDITKETTDVLFSADGIEALTVEEKEIEAGSLTGMTVIVDAGHGGTATGTARGSLVEKDCVLEIAYRLKAILEEAGARVILTRSDNTTVSLTYRNALANYVMLDDIMTKTENKIETERKNAENILNLFELSKTELKSRMQALIAELTAKKLEIANKKALLQQYSIDLGTDSEEYKALSREIDIAIADSEELFEEQQFLTKAYYCNLMGVSAETFAASYREKIDELSTYYEKMEAYRNLFNVNINSPLIEYEGLYVKTYDTYGNKIIEPELAEVFDITGSLCTENYVFISIHVNGVDNAPEVNGTEIYVRNGNTSAYGINKNYYGNYCTAQRTELAESIRAAMTEVDPMSNGKEAKIKDADFFVLRESNMPSVLIETGYSTNEHDRLELLNPKSKYNIAYSIYKGISIYYNN